MAYDLTIFNKGLDQLNIQLSDQQKDQFIRYYEMLIETNKYMNLTAITDFDEVIIKHFLDSLCLVKAVDGLTDNKIDSDIDDRVNNNREANIRPELSIIDIGTGAGFPGIPLKIAFPQLKIVLMDSLNKRINFLNNVIEELGLENIRAVHSRAEDLGHNKDYREKFDLCLSRAVANLSTLSEYCLPFVKAGGHFISYKSGQIKDEAAEAKNAIFLLGGKLSDIVEYNLPDTDMGRSLLVIDKVHNSPKTYPRKAGIPSKKPL